MKKFTLSLVVLMAGFAITNLHAQVDTRWDVTTPGNGNSCFRQSVALNGGKMVAIGDFQSSSGEAPTIMQFDPTLPGFIQWCIQLGGYMVDYMLKDALGTGVWSLSTYNGSLLHFNALGNFVQGLQIIANQTGYNVTVDKATIDPVSNNLIVAGSIIDGSNNTRLYIANINPSTNQIVASKIFTLNGNMGFYDFIQIMVVNNFIFAALYDGNVNNRTYLIAPTNLTTLSAYFTPFGYVDPKYFTYDPVSGKIIFIGSGISGSCTGSECAMIAYFDPLNPLTITANFIHWASNYIKYLVSMKNYSGSLLLPGNDDITAWGYEEFYFPNGANQVPFAINFNPDTKAASLTEWTSDSGQWNGIEEGWLAFGCFENGLGGSVGVLEKLPNPESIDDCSTMIHPSVNTVNFNTSVATVNLTSGITLSLDTFTTFPNLVTPSLNPSCSYTCDLVALFINAPTVCAGTNVQFIDASSGNPGPAVWSWSFGDGGTSNQQSPSHIYANPGTYTVKLVVSDDWLCVDSLSLPITVCTGPNAGAFVPDPVCWEGSPITITMTDASTNGSCNTPIIGSYWTLSGDTISYQGSSHPYTFNQPGSWNVTHTVNDQNGCLDSVSIPIVIHQGPTADLISIDTSCDNVSVIFFDFSLPGDAPITSWKWDFDDGTGSSTLKNPVHLFSLILGQDFMVKLVVTDANGCSDSITYPIHIVETPGIAIQAVNDECYDGINGGNVYNFSYTVLPGDMQIASTSWDFGDGAKSNLVNPTHKYLFPGTYHVQVCVTDAFGCVVCDTIDLHIWDGPIANGGANDPICAGAAVHFTDYSIPGDAAINAWMWNFGDGGTSALQNPLHTYPIAGIYYVTLVVTDANGCQDEVTGSVLIYEISPAINADKLSVCPYETITFTDNSQPTQLIGNVDWTFGDGSNASGHQVTHSYTHSGVFQVTAVISDTLNSCQETTNIQVSVITGPDAKYINDTVCLGDSTHFSDTISIDAVTWYWDFNDGDSSWQKSPTHLFAHAGTYSVLHKVWNGQGCWDTITHRVFVDSLPPVANFTYLANGNNVQFTDTSQFAHRWLWDFGDGDTSHQVNPQHLYGSGGDYTVQLIVYNGCSSDTFNMNISITGIPDPGNLSVNLYPNPNQGYFLLRIDHLNSEKIMLSLSGISGAVLLERTLASNKPSLQEDFDLSHYAKGIYLLKIKCEEAVIVKKVVIQ